MRRLCYVIPILLIVWFGWLNGLPWWLAAVLGGGFAFALDRMWGVTDMLETRVCLVTTGAGLLCLVAAFSLTRVSSISLGEYIQFATRLSQMQRLLHYLPMVGLGLAFYGLLSWIRAWLLQRNEYQ